jgi:hypothetical protein
MKFLKMPFTESAAKTYVCIYAIPLVSCTIMGSNTHKRKKESKKENIAQP